MKGPERSRRAFMALAGGSVLGGAVLAACGTPAQPGSHPVGVESPTAATIDPTGTRQAGVSEPQPPQPNLLMVAYDVDGRPGAVLARMGTTIRALVAGRSPLLAGMDAGDLTVTVGVGPRLVAQVDAGLPGGTALPSFGHERLARARTGGDVIVQLCASDALVLPLAAAALAEAGSGALRERWRQQAFRGGPIELGAGTWASRDIIGFVDGIVEPRRAADLAGSVWVGGSSPGADGTVMVVRRMEVDLGRFLRLPVADQERIVGRRRSSGVPLSGGTVTSSPDLQASEAGRFLVAQEAHVRWASPAMSEVPTMLRRSYSFADTAAGLLFVSFQNDLADFSDTLQRMEGHDALLDHTLTTGSASALVLPGFDGDRPLGSTLF